MRIADSVTIAARGLRHAGLRTVLTMLGIVIGISSVILLMSIGASAQDLILGQVRGIGSNLIFVIPGGTNGSRFSSPSSAQGIVITTLNERDAASVRREPSVTAVAPEVRGIAKIVYGNNDTTVTYEGTNEDFFTIRNFNTDRGYRFTNSDVDSFNHVTVLGTEITKTLFGDVNPIDKQVRIGNATFRVVGVLEKKGVGAFGVDQDNLALIPISVAQKQLLGTDYYSALSIQAADGYDVNFAKSRVISVIRQNHHITDWRKDDFTVRTQEEALSILGNITSIMALFLTAIACISLIVGGIGIMNIMLVSVVERTKEIGLRKAVGATNRDILMQFLVEAVMLTFAGGIIGIVLGAGIAALAALVLKTVVQLDWTFMLPLSAVGLAVAVSSITGLLFGIYPARKAGAKNPIDALRYE